MQNISHASNILHIRMQMELTERIECVGDHDIYKNFGETLRGKRDENGQDFDLSATRRPEVLSFKIR